MGILACHGGIHVSVGPTWAENVVRGGGVGRIGRGEKKKTREEG